MRFREFGVLFEDQDTPDPVLNDLLTFLSSEAAEFQDDPDTKPEIQLDSLLSAMENQGHVGFNKTSLEQYFDSEESGLKNIIDAISDDTITLQTGTARSADLTQKYNTPPEQVVGKMARRAAKRGGV